MLAQVWCAATPAVRTCACIVFSHRFSLMTNSSCSHEELAACLGACRGYDDDEDEDEDEIDDDDADDDAYEDDDE